jgi:hypothetical protein
MPALNEARIAFTCPRVNGISAISTCRRLAVGGNRFVVNPGGRRANGVTSVLTLGQSTSPLCLIECCLEKLIQFPVTQLADGMTQVLGQDVPL